MVDRLGSDDKWRNLAKHTIAGLLPPEELEDFWAARPPVTAVLHLGASARRPRPTATWSRPTNLDALPLWLWCGCAERQVPLRLRLLRRDLRRRQRRASTTMPRPRRWRGCGR